MDVLYFLSERALLVRRYSEHAAKPLYEITRKIDVQ
jgi:hypothetical protein